MQAADSHPKDLLGSLAILIAVVALALAGLAADGNWPKVGRVAASFTAYVVTLFMALRLARRARNPPPFWTFALAAAVAGIVSGLVREEVRAGIVVAGAIGGALLLGGTHWFGLRYWRRLRSALTS